MRSPRMHQTWTELDAPHFITSVTHKRIPFFRNDEHAKFLLDQLNHYAHALNIELVACVIMHDHFHCIIWPQASFSFSDYIHRVKSYTANQLSKPLQARGTKKLWQDSFFNYIIASEQKFEEKIEYIMNNPVEAGYVSSWQSYPYMYIHPEYTIE